MATIFHDREKVSDNFDKNLGSLREAILKNKGFLNESSKVWQDFGEPAAYFHKQAIEASSREFLEPRHFEMVYAVLTAWGMEKGGNTGLVRYSEFVSQINSVVNDYELRKYQQEDFPFAKESIEKIIAPIIDQTRGLKVNVAPEARLVSASKALHHILPNMFPPIDNAYRSFGRETQRAFLLNDTENWDIMDASLAREIIPVIISVKDAGLSQSDTNYWRNGDRKLKAQFCAFNFGEA